MRLVKMYDNVTLRRRIFKLATKEYLERLTHGKRYFGKFQCAAGLGLSVFSR